MALLALAAAACSSSGTLVRGGGGSGSGTVGPSSSASSSASSIPPTSSSTPAGHPTIVITPSHGLAQRQVVTVRGRGFTPGEALQAIQCAAKGAATGPGDCNLAGMLSVTADATGAVTVRLTVVRGPFGTNRITCGPSRSCLVSVTQASLTPTEEADAEIGFAPR